jgi:hypothetical protein
MKINVDKHLLEQELKAICNCVNKSAEITSPSRYVVMEATTDVLVLSVANQELPTQIRITPLQNILSIESPGKCAFDGILFLKFLETAKEGLGVIEFKPLTDGDDGQLNSGKKDEAAKEPEGQKVGKRLGTLMALFGNDEEVAVQTVDLESTVNLEDTAVSALSVKAMNFTDILKKVGISVGDKALDYSHVNVQLKAKDTIKLFTFCHSQFSIGEVALDTKAEFDIIVEYEKIVKLSNVMDIGPDAEPIEISYCEQMKAGQTTKKGIFIRQPVKYGVSVLGTRTAKLLSSVEKFPNIEKKIEKTDFKTTCKFIRSNLKDICDTLELIDGAKTHLIFETGAARIIFQKNDGRSKTKRVLSITDITGESIEVDLPTSHLSLIAGVCSDGDAKMLLSGEHSVIGIESGTFRTFFMPF